MNEYQNFNINLCFPTPILSTINVQLAEKMLPLAHKYLNDDTLVNKTILGYKSTFDIRGTGFNGIEKFAEMQDFNVYICDIAHNFFKQIGYEIEYEFRSQIFVSEMIEGDDHPVHTHQNSILSGIFYLQTPENCSPITFHDPKPKRLFVKHKIKEQNDITLGALSMQPQKGMLLMWESWLEHSVEKNPKISEGRISIVFNIIRK